MDNTSGKYRELVLSALFAAIVIVLGFTPLGMVPLGVIKATTLHIPVIIGSLVLGPKKGAMLGTLFGICSLISNTFTPALLSFAFSPAIALPGSGETHGSAFALIICFIPRILVGVVPYYIYKAVQKISKSEKPKMLSLVLAGISGALVNTALVMSLIYFIFKDAYATAKGISADAVLGAVTAVISTNGLAEAALAGVLTAAIGKVLFKILK